MKLLLIWIVLLHFGTADERTVKVVSGVRFRNDPETHFFSKVEYLTYSFSSSLAFDICRDGFLPLSAVSKDEFDAHYRDIIQRLPEEYETLIPIDGTDTFFTDGFTECGFADDGSFFVRVPVPIVRRDEKWTQYDVKPLSFRAGLRGSCSLYLSFTQFLYEERSGKVITLQGISEPKMCLQNKKLCKLPSSYIVLDDETLCIHDLFHLKLVASEHCTVKCNRQTEFAAENNGRLFLSGIPEEVRVTGRVNAVITANDNFGATQISIPCKSKITSPSHSFIESLSQNKNCVWGGLEETLAVPFFFYSRETIEEMMKKPKKTELTMNEFLAKQMKYEFVDEPSFLENLQHDWENLDQKEKIFIICQSLVNILSVTFCL